MRNKLIYATAILLLLSSCDKREFYTPTTENGQTIEHPGRAIITITGNSPEDAKAIFYAPGKSNIEATTGTPIDIEAGDYQVVIITHDEDLIVNGTTITLPTSEDGETIQAPAFYVGAGNITIKEGEVTKFSIPLHPMTREIHFQFSIRGVSGTDIQKLEVLLYGILNSSNINEGFIESTPSEKVASSTFLSYNPRSETPLYYIRTIPEQKEGGYYSNIRLLGTDSMQKQEVAVHITLNDGTLYTFKEDVSSYLSDFNKGSADIPLVMRTQIILDINGVTGNIKPWKPGREDDLPME